MLLSLKQRDDQSSRQTALKRPSLLARAHAAPQCKLNTASNEAAECWNGGAFRRNPAQHRLNGGGGFYCGQNGTSRRQLSSLLLHCSKSWTPKDNMAGGIKWGPAVAWGGAGLKKKTVLFSAGSSIFRQQKNYEDQPLVFQNSIAIKHLFSCHPCICVLSFNRFL